MSFGNLEPKERNFWNFFWKIYWLEAWLSSLICFGILVSFDFWCFLWRWNSCFWVVMLWWSCRKKRKKWERKCVLNGIFWIFGSVIWHVSSIKQKMGENGRGARPNKLSHKFANAQTNIELSPSLRAWNSDITVLVVSIFLKNPLIQV